MIDALLQRLCDLVPPPTDPQFSSGDWATVEESLGLTLPADYKRLIETFGQGDFVGHVYCSGLLISSHLRPDAARLASKWSEMYRSLGPTSYALYPDIPGLLYLGSYGEQDEIAWHTVGEPDEWPIVYRAMESRTHEIHDMGILEFTVSMLEESSPLHESVIRKGNLTGPHSFVPEP